MPEVQGQQEQKLRDLTEQLWQAAGRPTGRRDEFRRLAEERLGGKKSGVPNDDLDMAGEHSFPASDPVNHT